MANAAHVSERAAAVPAFEVMEVLRAAAERNAELEASGSSDRVVHLEIGQPASGAPEVARNAAIAALQCRTDPLGYTLASGEPELQQGIANAYKDRYGVVLSPDNIAITTGSSGAFVAAFAALFDTGDRVACPVPGYPCYRNTLATLGVNVVMVETHASDGYVLTPEMLEVEVANGGSLAGVVVASPCNPTGVAMSRESLLRLAHFCKRSNIHLIVDEIYHFLNLSGERLPSALEVSDSVIVISSFSKYWCLAGYRVGFLISRWPSFMETVERLLQNLHISAPTISQRVARAALLPEANGELNGHLSVYKRSVRMLVDTLPGLGFEEVVEPQGAFYIYASCSQLLTRLSLSSSIEFCRELLQNANVALTPGTDFDPIRGHHYVRFSVAGPFEDVVEGISRITKWLARE